MDPHGLPALCGIAALSCVLSFAGATVGLVLGHLRLPLLIAYLGSPVAGASTNLAVSGLGALAGTVRHARGGRVSLPVLAVMGIPSVLGAALGVLLFVKVNRVWAHVGLGAVLAVMGWRMARASAPEPAGEGAGGTAPTLLRGPRLFREVGIGLLLGALSSVTGLMMSSLRMPVLLRVMKVDPKVAVGTNMAIGFLTALAGALTCWGAGGGFDLVALAVVGPPTMLGSYLGALVTGKLSKQAVQRLMGWTIAALGVFMVVQGGWKASRGRDLQPAPHTPSEVRELEDEDDEWPGWLGDVDGEDAEGERPAKSGGA